MIATSPDGQWAAVKRGREVMLLAVGDGPAAAGPTTDGPTTVRIDLPTDDADLVMVGPPSVLAVVTRAPAGGEPGSCIALYQPPGADAVARHELDAAMRIAALTGSRLVLVSLDGKAVTIVRIAGRALATQALDPGSPVEFAVGLERNQVLLSLLRKLETWDAVSGRPLLRMQLPLPPPPRTVGPAHGFLWATRRGSDEILVCRLSDGRPFRHALGVPIDEVIYHPASPLLILVTARGLVRLHCYAHSLTLIEAPWRPGTALGQLVAGEDISLLGITEDEDEPWRLPIGGSGAPAIALDAPEAAGEPVVTAADKLRAMRERSVQEVLGRGDPPERAERPEPAERPDTTDRAPPVRSGALERIRGLRISLADRTDPVTRLAPPDRSELLDRGDRPDPSDPSSRGGDLDSRLERRDPLGHGERSEPVDPTGGSAPRPAGGALAVPTPHLAALDPTAGSAPRPAGGALAVPTPHLAALDPTAGSAPRPAGGALAVPTPHLAALDPTAGSAPRPAGGALAVPTPHLAALDRGADRPAPFNRRDPAGHSDERGEHGEPTERSAAFEPADRGDRFGRGDRADRAVVAPRRSPALSAMALRPAEPHGRTWRDRLAAFGAELVRAAEAELPVATDAELADRGELGELGELAHRLALPAAARRALVALYSLYLVGEPAVSLARLAHALGDWTEPLGQGELGALAMLRRRRGRVELRRSVTDLLDGVGPRAIRVIGTAAGAPRPGAARVARDGRSDAAIETELAGRLGRIAVIEGGAALALLEARLHGATAVALVPPLTRPLPWPRDAGLVVVAEPAAPAWVAALPALTAA